MCCPAWVQGRFLYRPTVCAVGDFFMVSVFKVAVSQCRPLHWDAPATTRREPIPGGSLMPSDRQGWRKCRKCRSNFRPWHQTVVARSEERRVGKECRARWEPSNQGNRATVRGKADSLC